MNAYLIATIVLFAAMAAHGWARMTFDQKVDAASAICAATVLTCFCGWAIVLLWERLA